MGSSISVVIANARGQGVTQETVAELRRAVGKNFSRDEAIEVEQLNREVISGQVTADGVGAAGLGKLAASSTAAPYLFERAVQSPACRAFTWIPSAALGVEGPALTALQVATAPLTVPLCAVGLPVTGISYFVEAALRGIAVGFED